MAADHTAAASASGYLYQCERALLELVRRAPDALGLTLFLERLDDFHFEEAGQPVELLQSKHHVDRTAELTDMSPDVWRTIAIWVDVLPRLGGGESPALTLITTATAPDGSAASLLRPDQRNPRRALELLLEAARASQSQTTAEARGRFLALDHAQQLGLVEATTVLDRQPPIGDLDGALARELYYAYPNEHRNAFLERLKGWWYARAVALLQGDLEAITARDLVSEIEDLTDQFRSDNLPSDAALIEPDDETTAGYAERPFVRQLDLIAVGNRALQLHMRDYFRAYTQRSRWMREGLIEIGELDRFERKLVDEWEHVFEDVRADLAEGAAEEERQQAGRGLLRDLGNNSTARVRARFDERFLTRGTLHELADQLQVGWHPDYEARLEELFAARARDGR